MTTETHDIVVVGGGTGGAFAAATAAAEGVDVVLLERKSETDAGHIACGDAIKGTSTFPDVIDREYLREEAFTNDDIRRARFLNPADDEALDIPFPGDTSGAIVDRKRYGEVLLEEADRQGATIHYDTVVRDVCQDEDGRVTGVRAMRKGEPVTYQAAVTVDAAGALSILQDKADLSEASFDTAVNYQQFCSAYREVIEVDEPVEYDDAIVFKPTEELGYLWYFPRTPTVINVGLGFQMNKPSMELVDALKRDLHQRPEFEGAEVKDKLGASLPTRRPYDSAVAPGYVAVGDAAGHVNPTTGGGIPGAAKAGHWAAERAVEAVSESAPTEATLWEYNRAVMTDFGRRFAAMDLYNIWGGTRTVDELTEIVAAMPAQALVDALGRGGTASMGLGLKLRTAVKTFGHWTTLRELYKIHKIAGRLKDIYAEYPASPDGFAAWQERRDGLMDEFYDVTGADPKY
ncbi:MAG: geranylgeranyl reductase family protein [Halobacteriaceae archaeon]